MGRKTVLPQLKIDSDLSFSRPQTFKEALEAVAEDVEKRKTVIKWPGIGELTLLVDDSLKDGEILIQKGNKR